MRALMAGIAAAALAVGAAPSFALAQPGQGNGKGNDKSSAAHGNGGGPAKAQGNSNGNGNSKKAAVQQRSPGNGNGNAKSAGSAKPNTNAKWNGNGNGNGNAAASKIKINGAGNGNGNSKRDVVIKDRDDRRYSGREGSIVDRIARLPYSSNRGLIDGCPPGLQKKNPPCVPPGLAKGDSYYQTSYYRPSFFGIGGIGDGRYYYDNGYLYRLGGNDLISAFIPLLGGALSIGNQWPGYYQPATLDPYYVDYYRLGSQGGYRYADNVVYRVDPETTAITSIAALLTGDDFRVGQPMPAGYDVYNVPYGYRDRYYDRPDAYYRYADGYVYQVDPETRLIAAAIELLI